SILRNELVGKTRNVVQQRQADVRENKRSALVAEIRGKPNSKLIHISQPRRSSTITQSRKIGNSGACQAPDPSGVHAPRATSVPSLGLNRNARYDPAWSPRNRSAFPPVGLNTITASPGISPANGCQ